MRISGAVAALVDLSEGGGPAAAAVTGVEDVVVKAGFSASPSDLRISARRSTHSDELRIGALPLGR